MATAAQWVSGARLRTLPLAIAPVIIGTGAALGLTGGLSEQFIGAVDAPGHTEIGAGQWTLRFVLALGVALLLQIGTNFANDYSDGVRGTDEERVGPLRLTASGAAAPHAVKRAAFGAFAAAAVLGLVLVVLSQAWWFLLIGAICLPAAWLYTGGKHPYGYIGLGEVFVFVFFGLVATLGTTYTQVHSLSACAWGGAVGIGLISCGLLMANNLRDIPTDREAGKTTLAVRIGDVRARHSYAVMLTLPFLLLLVPIAFGHWGAALALLALTTAVTPVRTVLSGATGAALVPVLKQTGIVALTYGALLALGLSL
ncbi:1,4-dihydroxy-2-naphthoate polyprenyltransferase [Spelaeicoccus albus]|uniref:1,4-dihydroxy-2-naphthoate octaprenyltransferase n=1 Tax=Spelaeicoccus albus TaxID=1280376 RepID=A0A7Z0D5P4_9MICO|nr:1,4-dihydroxy-2-naphthoate polyprenyltransferase [Spelaeicoccus albus]NYI69377.1 1,4-dihydroxy-2-naphthoate octaprenyltransferase [Spelaeicoccus albus]